MLADSYAAQYAKQAGGTLNSFSATVKTMGDIFEHYQDLPEEIRRKSFSDILKRIPLRLYLVSSLHIA